MWQEQGDTLGCEQRLPRWSNLLSEWLKWSQGAMRKFVLHTSHPACFSMNFWISEPCLNLISLLWRLDSLTRTACVPYLERIQSFLSTSILHLHHRFSQSLLNLPESFIYNIQPTNPLKALPFFIPIQAHCYLVVCIPVATSDLK